MKKLLSIFFSLLYITSFATKYYVSVKGSDNNTGTSMESAWATVHFACKNVTASGDVIHIAAGNYKENLADTLSAGVSIEGEGYEKTFFTISYIAANVYDGAIRMVSHSNIAGNQSISNLTLDGNNKTATRAILVRGRSNVSIYNCFIQNFASSGVYFMNNFGGFRVAPALYDTNNQLYNCTISNSADRAHGGGGNGFVCMSGQDGTLIHDNIFIDTLAAKGHNGDILGCVEGNNRGLKYYNNTSYKPVDDSIDNLALEFWSTTGGMTITNNTFYGGGIGVDVGSTFAIKGSYPYSFYIADNNFIMTSQAISEMKHAPCAADFEGDVSDAIFQNNFIINLPIGVIVSATSSHVHLSNISIINNLIANDGYVKNTCCSHGIYLRMALATDTLTDLFVYNNTISGGAGVANPNEQINISNEVAGGLIKRIYLKNNIIQRTSGSGGYLAFKGLGNTDSVFSQNNIIYGNANSNNPYYKGATNVTNFTASGNLITNPLLSADYKLQIISPAKGAGIDLGYGNDIGAFRYSGSPENQFIKMYGALSRDK